MVLSLCVQHFLDKCQIESNWHTTRTILFISNKPGKDGLKLFSACHTQRRREPYLTQAHFNLFSLYIIEKQGSI